MHVYRLPFWQLFRCTCMCILNNYYSKTYECKVAVDLLLLSEKLVMVFLH